MKQKLKQKYKIVGVISIILIAMVASIFFYFELNATTTPELQLTSYTSIGSYNPGDVGRVSYNCPTTVPGINQTDFCRIKRTSTGGGDSFSDIGAGTTFNVCFYDSSKTNSYADQLRACCIGQPIFAPQNGAGVDCCASGAVAYTSSGYPYCITKGTMLNGMDRQNFAYVWYAAAFTTHFYGNGICYPENNTPYNKNCANDPQDCGNCPIPPPPQVCTPSAKYCYNAGGDSQVRQCSSDGTSYTTLQDCGTSGCSGGVCLTPNTCPQGYTASSSQCVLIQCDQTYTAPFNSCQGTTPQLICGNGVDKQICVNDGWQCPHPSPCTPPECTQDSDCHSCFAICSNGICENTTAMPSPQCSSSVWQDYPTCKWDNTKCNNIPIGLVIFIIILAIIIVAFIYYLKRIKVIKW
jgi:hypothetical protein